MKKIEYRQIEYSHYPYPEELNKEGIDGWEVIHILPINREYFNSDLEFYYTKEMYKVTFKREIYGKQN